MVPMNRMNDSEKAPATTVNSIGMEFVMIPPGSFRMGGDKNREQAEDHENPIHTVSFSKPILMGKHAVTQGQWFTVMDGNPSRFKDDLRPVEMVSWNDAQVFIKALNNIEKTETYRLPTEAEWEYAARAGSESAYAFGGNANGLGQYAWYRKNSHNQTHPVGELEPNAWGLYDMHGNVHEWCQDWFDREYYSRSPSHAPSGPEEGLARSLRGGDWGSGRWYCRCASRSLSSPDRRSNRVGFRLVHVV
jgi:formylglycine-generating enzyme required for sulfatase activity